MSATPHPSAFNPYLRHGWKLVPIQAGSKMPQTPRWNDEANCINESSDIPEHMGAGLAHAFSGTCAIDIDDMFGTMLLFNQRGLDLNAILNAPDAVQVNSGRQGSGKLLYRIDAPLPSKKIVIAGKTVLEFRCATSTGLTVQDLLPPSKHPSGTTYSWAGEGNWQNLPMLPPELMSWWNELVGESITSSSTITTLDDLTEARDALSYINPDCDHDTWYQCGMALASTGHQEAFQAWDEWSAMGQKYPGQRTLVTRWNSFKADHKNPITINTLFHYAREYGWIKPPVDITTLFTKPPEDTLITLSSMGMVVPPPGVDLNLFPAPLVAYAKEVSESVGADPLVSIAAGMSALCAAIDSRSRLEIVNGFKVPPVMWWMTIGSPADKKTPASKPMFDVLYQIEKEHDPIFRMDLQRWEAEEAGYAAAKKSFLDQAKAAEIALHGGDILDHLSDVPILRPAPVPKRLTVTDSTSQKLVKLCAERPEGLLTYLDEANGFFNKLCNPQSLDDRSTWLVGFESNRYNVDRVTAGSLTAENFAVSIYCNVQPKVFRKVVTPMSADGMLQRFIPVTLRGNMTRLGNPVPSWASVKSEYDHMVRNVHAAGKREYVLSPEAYRVFREFQAWVEKTKVEHRVIRSPDEFLQAFGKIEGTCGRLLLVMHMAERAGLSEVQADTVKRAVEITRGFIVDSLRYAYCDLGGLTEDSLEYWITCHILQIANECTVSLSGILRSGKRQFADMSRREAEQIVLDTMVEMEDCNWVKQTENNSRSVVWAINPELINVFAPQRKMILASKQASRDKSMQIVKSLGYEINPDKFSVRGAA